VIDIAILNVLNILAQDILKTGLVKHNTLIDCLK